MKKNKYKCGVYLLTGFPNAGKSTLINLLTKNKVSIVSPKVQTTQVNITGVLNSHTTQLIFTDTPGLVFEKKYKNKDISRSVLDKEMFIDYNIFVMDIQKSISKVTLSQIEKVNKKFKKNILVLNKIDLVKQSRLLEVSKIINEYFNFSYTFMISAKKKKGTSSLLSFLINKAPKRKWIYNNKVTVDKNINFRISEITREKIFNLINKEIPYLVNIDTKIIKEEKIIKVFQEIRVKKNSQKSIIIGNKGEKIKMIGTRSRNDIEKVFKKKVYLNLIVKVKDSS